MIAEITKSTSDILLLFICTALIFLMQVGFSMLEVGSVRAKNTVNVIMKNYIDAGVSALIFWGIGFGLMFGHNPTGWFGVDSFAFNNGSNWDFSFFIFQAMFAATAATIISGAVAERIRYWGYILVSVVITGLIYPVFGSWVWADYWTLGGIEETQGWLDQLGFIDFAGSTVVHAVGGWCALAGIVVLGPRLGRFGKTGQKVPRDVPGHNLPLVAFGAFILWVGWFGFNVGSLLDAEGNIGRVILNTHLAGSAGIVAVVAILAVFRRPIAFNITINGGLAGMVAICAGANILSPLSAIIIGMGGSAFMYLGMRLLERLRIDDAIGAVPVHAFAGTWGTIAAGLLNPATYFSVDQLLIQSLGSLAAFVWAFAGSWIVFTLVNSFLPLRVGHIDERRGLDYTEHNENGYPEFQTGVLHKGL